MSLKKGLLQAGILAGVAVGLAACQNMNSAGGNTVSKANLAGIWQCRIDYPKVRTIDQYEYLPASDEFQSVGNVAFQLNNGKYLTFARAMAGSWKLQGNTLTQQAYGSRGNPENAQLRQQMQKDKKVSDAITPFMRAVNHGADQQPTVYQIDSLQGNALTMHLQGQNGNIPVNCAKVAQDKVIKPLGEQPARILAMFKQQQTQQK